MKTLQLFLIALILAICASMVAGIEADENEFEEYGYDEEEAQAYPDEYDEGEEADDEDDEGSERNNEGSKLSDYRTHVS